VKYTRLLFCLLYSKVSKLGLCLRINSSAYVVSITSALAQCAVLIYIIPPATISLPRVFSVAWASLTSTATSSIVFFRWDGHVARMPMSRAPRQLLTSWVAHSRPAGCPQMTWGRTLENASVPISQWDTTCPRSSMSGSLWRRTGQS